MNKKVKIKLYMNGGFILQVWDAYEEFEDFKSNMCFWKLPDNTTDDGLFTFYNTADPTKWSCEDKMITVDCRQIVAYEVVGMYNMDEL